MNPTLCGMLDELSDMESEMKRRSMIYQCEEKRMIAHYIGTRPDRFDHWHARHWFALKARFYTWADRALAHRARYPSRYRNDKICGLVWDRYSRVEPFMRIRQPTMENPE